jgi:hypothetical protein
MEIKTILVPTDFSEYAAHAYQWATAAEADDDVARLSYRSVLRRRPFSVEDLHS